MWRRGGAVAASVLLGAGCLLAAAHPANAVSGSFTVVGGRTRWSFDRGKAITVTGTTNAPDPGPVTALLDGDSTGSGTADDAGNFSLTFTLPDTSCADGEANSHQLGVSFSDGGSLPAQQILYRCANYSAQPEFDGNATTYTELIDIDRAGASPYVAVCILATDPKNGQPLGHVVETGVKPPDSLSVVATYTAGSMTQTATLAWAGAAATVTDAPGCYLYSLPVPSPFSSPFTPYRVALTANLRPLAGVTSSSSSTSGPTARVLPPLLNSDACVKAGSPIPIAGSGFGSGNVIDLTFTYTAPAPGPAIRRHAATAGVPAPAGDRVTSRSDGAIFDTHAFPTGKGGGSMLVNAYLILADGSAVALPASVRVPLAAMCPGDAGYTGASLTLTPDVYAEVPGTNVLTGRGGNRYLTVHVTGLYGGQMIIATVNNSDSANFVDENQRPVTATTTSTGGSDGTGGGYDGAIGIPAAAVDCRQANTLELSTPPPPQPPSDSGSIFVPIAKTVTTAFYVTCPTISDAPGVHPAVPGDVTKPVINGFDGQDTQLPVPLTAGISVNGPGAGSFTPVAGTTAQRVTPDYFSGLALSFPTAPLKCGSIFDVDATQDENASAFDAPPSTLVPIVALCDGDPTLSATPASFAYSSGSRTLTLAATGLRPGSQQGVTIDGQPATPVPFTSAPNGTLTASLAEKGLSCGSHTVALVNQAGGSDDLPALAPISVSCPSTVVTPGSIADDDQPRDLAISGLGFDVGSAVTITLPDGQTKSADIGKDGTLSASNGTISSGILPCGTGVATVTEKGQPVTPQPSAQAAYVVTCPSPPTLTIGTPVIATTTGQRAITVTGTGWLPNSSQPVTYDGAALATASVDPTGAFSLTATLEAPTVASHALAAVQGRYRSSSTLLRVTAPALTASPDAFSRDAAPADITLAGTGYDPGYALGITVPGSADLAAVADSTGAFTTTVPSAGIACGQALAVSGTEPTAGGAPFTVGPTASTSLSVTCPNGPTLTPTPGVFAFTPVGHPITLVGSGFRPDVPVTVNGDGFPTQTVTTDSSGNVTVSGRSNAACGIHSLLAVPSVGYSAASTYLVTCPVVVSQPSDLDGLHLPDTISLAGTGYDPHSLVTLVLAQPNLPPSSVAVTTDANGSFVTDFPVGGLYCAPAPITGTESYPSTPPPTASLLDTVNCPKPVLTVTPKTVSDGVVAVYTGRNFHPGETVDLVWKLRDGSNGLGECQATVAEDTTISGGCLVFPHDMLGLRTLVATDERAAIGRAPVLVQQNPSEPGRQNGSSSGLALLSRR